MGIAKNWKTNDLSLFNSNLVMDDCKKVNIGICYFLIKKKWFKSQKLKKWINELRREKGKRILFSIY